MRPTDDRLSTRTLITLTTTYVMAAGCHTVLAVALAVRRHAVLAVVLAVIASVFFARTLPPVGAPHDTCDGTLR